MEGCLELTGKQLKLFANDSTDALVRATAPTDGSDRYNGVIHTLDPTYADYIYRTYPLASKIVDIIAEDALRNGRTFVGSENKEHAKTIADYEMRPGIDLHLKRVQAYKMARAHGGSAMLIGLRDDKPETLKNELNPEAVAINGLTSIKVLPRTHFNIKDFNRDIASKEYGKPLGITLSGIDIGDDTYMGEIHHSRFVFYTGKNRLPTDIITNEEEFWGDSVLMAILPIIIGLEDLNSDISGLISNQQVSIIKEKGLNNGLAQEGKALDLFVRQIAKVQQDFAKVRKNTKVQLIDADSEFSQHQNTFAGLNDLRDGYRAELTAAVDIPHTKLWGESADGMNATGKGDDKNYKAVLKGEQSLKIAPQERLLDQVLVRAAVGNVGGLTSRLNSPYDADIGEQLEHAKQRLEILDMVGPELGDEYADRLREILDSSFMKGE